MTAMAVSRSALLLLPLLQTTAIAMSAVSWIEKVQGETVVLGCTWTGDPTDTEVLDVEWFLQMPTTNIYVATFAGGEGHIYPDFASRVRFARNVTRRDASLQIAGLRASDAGVYTCKVKFGTFIKQETIRLTVLGNERTHAHTHVRTYTHTYTSRDESHSAPKRGEALEETSRHCQNSLLVVVVASSVLFAMRLLLLLVLAVALLLRGSVGSREATAPRLSYRSRRGSESC
ncbi:uncharacterized protein LOC142908617 [Petromyzon marinus]|uniref:uncharacterized protein LOC142908617 n=1 Tax=Petromyzon marinus TaxID=7757 RepID=UPI003F6FE3EC